MENNTMNLNSIANGVNETPQQPQTVVNTTQTEGQYYTVPSYTQPVNPVQQAVQQQVNEQAQAQVVQQSQTTVTQPVQETVTQVPGYGIFPPVQEPVKPVYEPPTYQQPVNNVQPEPQPVVNTEVQSQVEPIKRQEPQPVVEEKKDIEPITVDNYLIKIEDLQRMVNNATKVAIKNEAIEITTVLQLMFTKEGLVMKVTDNENTLTQINRNIRYENEVSIGIRIDKFAELVSKLDVDYVLAEPDIENHTFIINTEDDTFIFEECYDKGTGEVVQIPDNYNVPGDKEWVIDLDLFKAKLAAASDYAASTNVDARLSGVYSGEVISATDNSGGFITPNIPELVNEKIYFTRKFLQAVKGISYKGEVTLSLKYDEQNNVVSMSLYDEDTVLSGPSNEDRDVFPIDSMVGLSGKERINKCVVNGRRFSQIIQIVKIFMSDEADKGLNIYTISEKDKTITIKDRSGRSKQIIPILNITGKLPYEEFMVANIDISRVANTLDMDEVSITFESSYVVFDFKDTSLFVTLKEDN